MKKYIKFSDGTQIWLESTEVLHNADGPAIIYPDGSAAWYKNGNMTHFLYEGKKMEVINRRFRPDM